MARTLEEGSLPVCITTWETNGVRMTQTAFVTALEGLKADSPVPRADTFTVLLARFVCTNVSQTTQTASLGAGSHPLDEAVSGNGQYLYNLTDGAHRISAFRIAEDGSLSPAVTIAVPAGAAGLAAR